MTLYTSHQGKASGAILTEADCNWRCGALTFPPLRNCPRIAEQKRNLVEDLLEAARFHVLQFRIDLFLEPVDGSRLSIHGIGETESRFSRGCYPGVRLYDERVKATLVELYYAEVPRSPETLFPIVIAPWGYIDKCSDGGKPFVVQEIQDCIYRRFSNRSGLSAYDLEQNFRHTLNICWSEGPREDEWDHNHFRKVENDLAFRKRFGDSLGNLRKLIVG